MTSSSPGSYVTIKEFIQLAVQFEIDSVAFYRDLQQTAKKSDVLDLLNLLERQEIEHRKILENYEIAEDPESMLQFPPSLTISMPAPPSESPSFDEMITLAIAREKTSAEIYEKARDLVAGALKELLTGLATFERQHEERLKKLQLY